tara:strand:- start:6996 stop:7859 length:864 start_codon:yes stop_codon:yes gene_type:complete
MEENNEINFFEILEIIWNEKFKILLVSFSLGSILFVYSLFLQDVYISETKLKVVNDDMSRQLEASNLGIFNFFQQGNQQSGFIEDHVKSRDFFKIVSQNTNLIIPLLELEDVEGLTEEQIKSLLYSQSIKEKYKDDLLKVNFLSQHSAFSSSFEIDTSKGPFIIRSFHKNPFMTKVILDVIVEETNAYFKQRDDKESKDAIDFISRELPKNQIIDIQETLSNVLSAKLRTLVLSNIKTDYVLEYIDSPYVPISANLPDRRLYFLSGMIIGLILSIFWVLTRKFLLKG